jgi:methionine synthase I (cobalamin-dependent)
MGHSLRRHGVTITGEVGSQERFLGVAMVNKTNPELVKECHLEFINAGA